MRLPVLAPRFLVPAVALVALAACGDDDTATSSTSSGSTTVASTSSTGTSTSGSGGQGSGESSTTGAGGQGGAASTGQGGGGAHSDLLPGDWKPTGMNDSGMGFKPADPNSPLYVFTADGKLSLGGCGVAPMATWTFTEGGPSPAVGVITVKFGSTTIQWYVLELDATKLIFGEGGDLFYFARSKCG